MLHKAKVAICSDINKKYLNIMWAECTILRSVSKIAKSDY